MGCTDGAMCHKLCMLHVCVYILPAQHESNVLSDMWGIFQEDGGGGSSSTTGKKPVLCGKRRCFVSPAAHAVCPCLCASLYCQYEGNVVFDVR